MGRTDERTDIRITIYTPNFVCRGIKIFFLLVDCFVIYAVLAIFQPCNSRIFLCFPFYGVMFYTTLQKYITIKIKTNFFFAIFIKKSCVHFLKIHKQGVHGRDAFCYVCINSVHWLWRSKLFILSMLLYFHYFIHNSPWKRSGDRPFIWTNLNFIHPRILCAKFWWNWSSGFGEENQNVKILQQQRSNFHQKRSVELSIRKAPWSL